MNIPLFCIVTACIAYTGAIWTERFTKRLTPAVLFVFVTGFVCDVIGTGGMFLHATHPFAPSLHGTAGLLALLIMALHLGWAILGMRLGGRYAHYFSRFSIFAWTLWLLAFISGMPKKL